MYTSPFFMTVTKEQGDMTSMTSPSQARNLPCYKAFCMILHHTASTICMISPQQRIQFAISMPPWVFQQKPHSWLRSAMVT
ncbi:hypothetical protein ACHAW6_008239 [Cyclotella cf. meneghiniana]